jgi:hypothetical protein
LCYCNLALHPPLALLDPPSVRVAKQGDLLVEGYSTGPKLLGVRGAQQKAEIASLFDRS